MKLTAIVLATGLAGLYFLTIAFRIELFNWEMLIHSGIRFVLGFILLGASVFYAHILKLKNALYLVLALLLADDVLDYFRNVDSFTLEIMLYGVYMLVWGALTGFLFMKSWRTRNNR